MKRSFANTRGIGSVSCWSQTIV